MNTPESRAHKRVQFFLVHLGEHEIKPVWVFKSTEQSQAMPGLLLNLSEGGMQILTELESSLTKARYQLSFLKDEASPGLNLADCQVQLLWSEHEAGMHTRSGFAFVGQMPDDLKALLTRSDAEKIYLRCTIEAAVDVNAEVTTDPIAPALAQA